jgi:hypothetical protein
MKKSGLPMIAFILISMTSFSQTIKGNIEKLSKDRKTAENAAKADVYISGKKKVVSDTTIKQAPNSEVGSKTSRKKKQRLNHNAFELRVPCASSVRLVTCSIDEEATMDTKEDNGHKELFKKCAQLKISYINSSFKRTI